MFVKLAVVACSVVAVMGGSWHGPLAGGLPADLYPAGVSPQACPNYPHCDNPAVAVGGAHGYASGWNGAHAGGWEGAHTGAWNGAYAGAYNGHNDGAWNGHNDGAWNGHNDGHWDANHDGQWNGHQSALDKGEYTGDGDYRGEGLAESGAYGQVYHGDSGAYSGHGHQAYAGAYGHAAQYPAGVDPHSCPNYPYCH